MKKIIISTLAVMLAMPAVATGISPNDTGDNMCIYNVLNTYTGPANLQAGWQANTIQLKWYNGDQQLNVQSAANNCTYDSGLTIPSTAPTKTGYTFAGWKVKTASGGLCGLTSEMMEVNAMSCSSHGLYGDADNCSVCDENNDCEHNVGAQCSNINLNLNEWKTEFNYGTYRGTASCNNTSGEPTAEQLALAAEIESDIEILLSTYGDDIEEAYENGQMTASDAALFESIMTRYEEFASMLVVTRPSGTFNSSSTGQYCWCHAESYTPNGGGQCSLSSLSWVYTNNYDSAFDCANSCAMNCGRDTHSNPDIRRVLFGVTGN